MELRLSTHYQLPASRTDCQFERPTFDALFDCRLYAPAEMLIARAPTRISYAGGGTDVEPYCTDYGGVVVSAAIDKYFYVFISPNGDGALQISSADYRAFLRYGTNGDPIGIGGELSQRQASALPPAA